MDTIVAAICERENLRANTITRLSGGQINHVYLVDDRYIVRIGARENACRRLKRETALLQSLVHDLPVPRVLALGQHKDYAYQVQTFIEGEPLHHLWPDLPPGQKAHLVGELATYLQTLHANAYPGFGPHGDEDHHQSWSEFCKANFYNTLADFQALNLVIPPAILKKITDNFKHHKHVLHAAEPVLVHGDLWPGNILVNNGSISAILDFEFAAQAPRDYELMLIEQFCLYPNDFAEEDNAIYTTADFADFFQLLKQHYPALFAVRDLRERLNLYHIIYSLEACVAWQKTQPQTKERYLPIQPLAKVLNFLSAHGTRMTL